MLMMFRLRRAAAILGVGLTAALAGACAAVVLKAIAIGWFYRLLVAVAVVVLLRMMLALLSHSRALRLLINRHEELRRNDDLGTRPKLIAPLSEEEKRHRTFWKRIFPNDD